MVGSLKEAWESAKRHAKVQVRWHDLRHTCCTRLVEAGVSLHVIASILGWSASTTVRMAHRYGHVGRQAQREAVTHLETVAKPAPQSDLPDGDTTTNAVH